MSWYKDAWKVGGDIVDGVKEQIGLGPADTKATEDAIKGQSDFADVLKGQYGDFTGTPAASSQGEPAVGGTRQNIGPARGEDVPAPEPFVPAVTPGSPAATGNTRGVPIVAGPGELTAQTMGPITVGQAPVYTAGTRVPATHVDRGVSDRLSGALDEAYGLHRSAALGLAPSAAEGTLRRGLDEAIAAQMAAAQSARGRNVGLAQRGALMAGARLQQQGANDAAILRAKEMADARKAYADALSAGRTQDVGIATTDATFDNTVKTEQYAADEKAKEVSSKLIQDGQFKQADIDELIASKNTTFINDLALEMKKLGVQVNETNAKNILDARGLDDDKAYQLAMLINQAYSNRLTGGKAMTEASSEQNTRMMRVAGAVGGGIVGGPAGAQAGANLGETVGSSK